MSSTTPSRSTSARRSGLRLVVTAGALALSGGLLAPPLALASPVPDPKAPNSAAEKAGVQRGNATMGWRDGVERATSDRVGALAKITRAGKLVPMTGVLGIDVSSYQGIVDWVSFTKVKRSFVYVKATEGSSYRNPYFGSQYGGAKAAGMFAGAYHFANPSGKSGKTQATYFVKYGGGWTKDGKTLPGVLDIEYNPYGGNMCYGLSKTKMVAWIKDFLVTYKKLTTRDAVIYTTTDWWTKCTGNTTKFRYTNPLWAARWTPTTGAGKLPGGWPYYTFWQYSSKVIDQNRVSNTAARVTVLATNSR
jgi:GH25 family lysozyme M1 (1,4-beta-N-acetylmuramidase)